MPWVSTNESFLSVRVELTFYRLGLGGRGEGAKDMLFMIFGR